MHAKRAACTGSRPSAPTVLAWAWPCTQSTACTSNTAERPSPRGYDSGLRSERRMHLKLSHGALILRLSSWCGACAYAVTPLATRVVKVPGLPPETEAGTPRREDRGERRRRRQHRPTVQEPRARTACSPSQILRRLNSCGMLIVVVLCDLPGLLSHGSHVFVDRCSPRPCFLFQIRQRDPTESLCDAERLQGQEFRRGAARVWVPL